MTHFNVFQYHEKTLNGPMKEWQKRKQYPPVLLLTGQTGIGKRSVAHSLAQWILCEKKNVLKPCEICSSCQKTKLGNEVNLMEITPPSDEESSAQTLKIDQFRKLKASSGFHAHAGTYKTVLIPNAERMTPQAANSMLKLLEEPPQGWIFFLTASDPTLLLPTIVSRCQVLRLKPFSLELIQELLQKEGMTPERAEISARFSQGSWNRALRFTDDLIWNQRKTFFHFFQDPGSVFHSLIEWASQDSSQLETLLDLLEQVTSDFIRWSVQAKTNPLQNYLWIHSDQQEVLTSYVQKWTQKNNKIDLAYSFWMNQAERLAKARQESITPMNRKLLIQDLLLPWMGAHA